MSRLTYRTENGWVGVHNLEDKTVSSTSVAIHKLAEFEDFMEDNGFRSFDDLYYAFGYIRFVDGYDEVKDEEIHKQEFIRYADAYKDRVKAYKELYNKNQALKDRWQKLKEFIVKEQGYASMYQLERIEALDDVKDKMQELEKE